ncbi:hypothetical protein M0804_014548 [Polistes exclamans]|nr:hypothetical protein M0804_014562 [Polistes exclamans]KAI4475026.1 hypothetical protein M0804_014548 [Polistes exclamans]
MTKNRCKICELLGESQIPNHGLSHPCHLTNLHQLNHHLAPGLNYNSNPSMNYLNHGLLNGLYLPQLKDMMLAAYLLRGSLLRSNYEGAAKISRKEVEVLMAMVMMMVVVGDGGGGVRVRLCITVDMSFRRMKSATLEFLVIRETGKEKNRIRIGGGGGGGGCGKKDMQASKQLRMCGSGWPSNEVRSPSNGGVTLSPMSRRMALNPAPVL